MQRQDAPRQILQHSPQPLRQAAAVPLQFRHGRGVRRILMEYGDQHARRLQQMGVDLQPGHDARRGRHALRPFRRRHLQERRRQDRGLHQEPPLRQLRHR